MQPIVHSIIYSSFLNRKMTFCFFMLWYWIQKCASSLFRWAATCRSQWVLPLLSKCLIVPLSTAEHEGISGISVICWQTGGRAWLRIRSWLLLFKCIWVWKLTFLTVVQNVLQRKAVQLLCVFCLLLLSFQRKYEKCKEVMLFSCCSALSLTAFHSCFASVQECKDLHWLFYYHSDDISFGGVIRPPGVKIRNRCILSFHPLKSHGMLLVCPDSNP